MPHINPRLLGRIVAQSRLAWIQPTDYRIHIELVGLWVYQGAPPAPASVAVQDAPEISVEPLPQEVEERAIREGNAIFAS